MTMTTQDELAKTIKALVEKADKAKEKAEQFYIAAGLHLITLKAEHKGTWTEWEKLVKKKCGLAKSRASELMRIAGGHTTLAEVRSNKAESVRNVRTGSPLRSGVSHREDPRKVELTGDVELDALAKLPADQQQQLADRAKAGENVTARPLEQNAGRAAVVALANGLRASLRGFVQPEKDELGVLQRAWDAAPHETRSLFAVTNAAELTGLIADHQKAVIVERAIARSATVPPSAPTPHDLDIPDYLQRSPKQVTH
jgi:hypothetical protein